jgi:hypothetical protein
MRRAARGQSERLPVEHARKSDGRPLCGARRRKWGWLFATSGAPTCRSCFRALALAALPSAAVLTLGRMLAASSSEKH